MLLQCQSKPRRSLAVAGRTQVICGDDHARTVPYCYHRRSSHYGRLRMLDEASIGTTEVRVVVSSINIITGLLIDDG